MQHFLKRIRPRRVHVMTTDKSALEEGLLHRLPYPRLKPSLSTQDYTHDTKAKPDPSPTWRCSGGITRQKILKEKGGCEHRVPACLAHARVTSRRSDCAGDSGVILSSWQKCKRCTSFSPFGI